MVVKYSLRNMVRCACHKCRSYPGALKELRRYCMPGVFCAKGISCVEVTKKGCICPSCRVYKFHSLRGSYYCLQIKVERPPEDKKDILVIPHEEKVPVGV